MATRVTEDVAEVWKSYKKDQSNQELRNRLVEIYLPLVKYNGERIWSRLPEGVDLKIDKQTHLVLSGHDKQVLGQTAANIRALRPPDPYKNKGIRYTGEVLRKKVGKTGATGAGAK